MHFKRKYKNMNNRCTILLSMLTMSGMFLLADEKKSQGDSNENMTPAQLQARDEMNALRPLAESITYGYFWPETRKEAQKVYTRSMRAWNLDPTNEEAAYYVCRSNPANYEFKDKSNGKYSCDVYKQTDEFCKKYLDFFGQRNEQHHYEICLQRQICLREYGTLKEQYEIFLKLVMLELQYPKYARASCPHGFIRWLEYISGQMSEDELQQAYPIWQNFITETYNPFLMQRDGTLYKEAIRRSSCPELLEATYWAYMKEPLKARAAITKAAAIYPKDMEKSWSSSFCKTPQETISSILRIAGDSEWQTWQPEFTLISPLVTGNCEVTNNLINYVKRNDPDMPNDWKNYFPYVNKLQLRYAKINLDIPEMPKDEAAKYTFPSNLHYIPMCPFDGDSQLFFSRSYRCMDDGEDTLLYYSSRSPLLADKSEICVNLNYIPWPEHPIPATRQHLRGQQYIVTDYYLETLNGKTETMWIGTASHGIVRFSRNKNGKWRGRWITFCNGLPDKSTICGIFPAKYKGQKGVLVSARYSAHVNGIQYRDVWDNYFIDEATTSVILLNHVPLPYAVNLENGPSVLLTPSGVIFSPRKPTPPTWLSLQTAAEATDYGSLKKYDIENATFLKFSNAWWPGYYAIKFTPDSYLEEYSLIHNKFTKLSKIFTAFGGWHTDGTIYDQIAGLKIRKKIPYYLPDKVCTIKAGKFICMVINNHNTPGYENVMIIWKPGSLPENPLTHDSWYGPFELPEKLQIESVSRDPDNYLWMRLENGGLYRLDIEKSVADAQKAGQKWTSRQLRDGYIKMLSSFDWRHKAHYYLAEKQIQQAISFLDDKISEFKTAGDLQSQQDAMMFKAAALSFAVYDYKSAIDTYENILRLSQDSGIVYLAKRNMGIITFFDGQYGRCVECLSKLTPDIQMSYPFYTGDKMTIQPQVNSQKIIDNYIHKAKEKIATK